MQRINYKAARNAWERAKGEIPAGLFINHTCGNKSCLNIEHMELITRCDIKQPRPATTRLTELEVKIIRQSTNRVSSLAKYFNVSVQTIYNIRKGKSWK